MKTKKASDKYPDILTKSDNLFPVVGVGASAGGLDAFKTLMKAIPINSGMAYVLVQHLAPNHDSLLPEILQKVTKVPVLEISDEARVEPNHIYVMPSNKVLVASDGVLLLVPRPEALNIDHRLPIDRFFKSLAEIHQEHAIGVVLSGTASDGTMGLKSIKDNGGITIAQDEESAAYPGMPNSAVDAGVVDFILSPDKIPGKLSELINITNPENGVSENLPPDDEHIFGQITTLLRDRKGTDFTYYKQTTIRRRILRRMALNKNTKVADYFTYLKNSTKEQDLLYQDFLIPVTSFFRNPKSFETLQKKFFPLIHKDKPDGKTIRVWVAGCSTGEEVYSIAICLKEFLDKHSTTSVEKRVQIFGTDLSELAVEKARKGIYSKLEVTDVSKKHLDEYFIKNKDGYQVNSRIRDLCVFAFHNFLKDPPFGKMDLISCRNVLIYMDPYLQKKALSAFHYALNQNGYLMLGKSETASVGPELFTASDKQEKIYSRKDVPSKFMQESTPRSNFSFSQSNEKITPKKKTPNFERVADELMLSKYAPSGVVVNENMDIVQFRGSTKNFLEQSSGKPSHNLLVLAKPGLSFELRNIIHKAKKKNEVVTKENIPLNIDGGLKTISIEAIPLTHSIESYYLILFHTNETGAENNNGKEIKSTKSIKRSEEDEKDLRIRQLDQELLEVREDMRNITEEQEVANEELQSANEELQSGSEELQSLNEELETSKEELQSTNEELIVVNQEMSSLNEQLAAERNYSQSIVANIREPLLVLDKNLRIKTANNAFYKVFKFTEEETDHALIYELGKNTWDIPDLRELLKKITTENTVITDFEITHTFEDLGEIIMRINARQITDEKSENLILLSIEDITEKVLERRKRRDIQELYTKELKEKVKGRTSELKDTNEELLERNEDLIKMNKELEAFAYVSSHDLQEPLRKIQTFASRILEKEVENLSEKGKNYFSMIEESANRMQGLIQDLLNFSRLTTEERTFETVNIKSIIDHVKDSFEEDIAEKKATINVSRDCEANVIVFQFHQLMHNLINNSLKYSHPDRPPEIEIKCVIKKGKRLEPKNLSPQKEYCHISFSDKGIGFEEEFSEKIFEVFQKLHTKEEYPGTGIGLATVKKIVNNHHGIVLAKGELDKGSTFDIYIPAHN